MPVTRSEIPPEIADEIGQYEGMVKKFLGNEISPGSFQRCRLQEGIYGQRQPGVQMCRIKIPLGMLNADQIECLADLAESIGHNNCHVTTRQDIQIHYVQLAKTPEMMRRLAAVGLTSREACGNTVRNVTASPSAGVDPEEVFDVTPYAHAFAFHLLRNPICQSLPRKFKAAFDGGGVMSALPQIHDFGLVAKVRREKGVERRGFEVCVGGGLGSSPRIAKPLHEFLPVEELIPWAESIIRLFDRYGERKIRMKARMKFLIDKMGFDRFRKMLEEERGGLEVDPAWNDYLRRIDEWTEGPPKVDETKIPLSPPFQKGGGGDFEVWKKTNVWPQKQTGYSMVEIRLGTGDITPKQMRPLAGILRRYAGGKCRTMVHQNLLIRWVRDRDLPSLFKELTAVGLARGNAQTIYDVTACPGTDTCRLGIASSMGLARVIEDRLYKEDGRIVALARDLRIKISGCPNSCGQHHIANIGLYGGAIPTNGHTAPAFQLMLGGDFGRDTHLAVPICQIPSKNVPEAVVRILRYFSENRRGGELFNAFYARLGKEETIKILGDLPKVALFEKRPELYVDWEAEREFVLQKGVVGECAGAAVADVGPRVTDGEEPLRMAEALLSHEKYESSTYKAYESIIKAADGLLFYRLVQPFSDVGTTHEWENHFVPTGLMPRWKGFHKKVQGLRKKKADEASAREWIDLAQLFLKDCLAKEPEIRTQSRR